jgi:HlyD family secretion protein
MSATVDIQTETRYDVLSIPIQAVTTRADTLEKMDEKEDMIAENKDVDKEVVFILSDDETLALQREVKTGIQDNNYIEVIEGIDEKDKVIIAPYSAVSKKLNDSTLVEVVSKKDLFSKKKKK